MIFGEVPTNEQIRTLLTRHIDEQKQAVGGDSRVFKRYSQAKLNMMREALGRLDRQSNEHHETFSTAKPN